MSRGRLTMINNSLWLLIKLALMDDIQGNVCIPLKAKFYIPLMSDRVRFYRNSEIFYNLVEDRDASRFLIRLRLILAGCIKNDNGRTKLASEIGR